MCYFATIDDRSYPSQNILHQANIIMSSLTNAYSLHTKWLYVTIGLTDSLEYVILYKHSS